MPKSKRTEEYITADQAAEIAGVHRKTIIDWIKRGALPAHKKGFGLRSPFLIRRADLENTLAARESYGEKK